MGIDDRAALDQVRSQPAVVVENAEASGPPLTPCVDVRARETRGLVHLLARVVQTPELREAGVGRDRCRVPGAVSLGIGDERVRLVARDGGGSALALRDLDERGADACLREVEAVGLLVTEVVNEPGTRRPRCLLVEADDDRVRARGSRRTRYSGCVCVRTPGGAVRNSCSQCVIAWRSTLTPTAYPSGEN